MLEVIVPIASVPSLVGVYHDALPLPLVTDEDALLARPVRPVEHAISFPVVQFHLAFLLTPIRWPEYGSIPAHQIVYPVP